MPVINRTPYRNLILTGTTGVGKTGVGREIARHMEDAHFLDLEIELQQRHGNTADEIKERFGIARLRTLESQLVDEISLRRSTIIAVSGLTLLEPQNLERLRETGPVLCLTAQLGEILRRLHVSYGGWFHEIHHRSVILGRIRREKQALELNLPVLDTTGLRMDEVAQQAKTFWLENSDL